MTWKEVNTNTMIVKSIRHFGFWAYKIPDLPAFKGSVTRFAPAKPCDIIANVNSRFVAIEGKFSNQFKGIGLSIFRDY